jgi:hypothetical protein
MAAHRRVIPQTAAVQQQPHFRRQNRHDRSCPVTVPPRLGRKIPRAIDQGTQSRASPGRQHVVTAAPQQRIPTCADIDLSFHVMRWTQRRNRLDCEMTILSATISEPKRPPLILPNRRSANAAPNTGPLQQPAPSGRITRLPGSPGPEPGKPRAVLDRAAIRWTSIRRCSANRSPAPPHRDDSI